MKNLRKTFDFFIIFAGIMLKYFEFMFNISKIYIYIYFATLIFLIILSFKNYKTKKWNLLKIFLITLGILIVTFESSGIDFAIPLLYALYYRNTNINKILKYILFSSAIMFLSTIILANLNIIQSLALTRLDNDIIVYRNSLGFGHVNAVFFHFYIIAMLLYIFINSKYVSSAIILIVSSYIYSKTFCRTGMICICIFILFNLFTSQKSKDIVAKKGRYFFLGMTIISFLLAFLYGTGNNSLDILVSYRFSNWYKTITNYSLINFIGIKSAYYLDNLYLNLIYNYGIISYILYLAVYYFSYDLIEDNKLKLSLVFFSIYGLFESNHVFYINYSLFVLLYYSISKFNKGGISKNEENKYINTRFITKSRRH